MYGLFVLTLWKIADEVYNSGYNLVNSKQIREIQKIWRKINNLFV